MHVPSTRACRPSHSQTSAARGFSASCSPVGLSELVQKTKPRSPSISGAWWGLGVLARSLVSGLIELSLREAQPSAQDTDSARTRDAERDEALVA